MARDMRSGMAHLFPVALIVVLFSAAMAVGTEGSRTSASLEITDDYELSDTEAELNTTREARLQRAYQTYKGPWQLRGSPMGSVDTAAGRQEMSSAHEGGAKEGTKLTEHYGELWLGSSVYGRNSGFLILKVRPFNKTQTGNVRVVVGDVVIRDGKYSTDQSVRYILGGVHYIDRNSVFLYGRWREIEGFDPLGVTHFQQNPALGVAGALLRNETFLEAMKNAQQGTELDALASVVSDMKLELPSACPLMMELELTELSLEAAEKVASRGYHSRLEKDDAKGSPESISDFALELELELDLESESDLKRAKEDNRKLRAAVTGSILSRECGFAVGLDATVMEMQKYIDKAQDYVVMMAFVVMIELGLLIRQLQHSSSQSRVSRVSLLCIGMQALLDAYLCLIHLSTAMILEPLFNAFGTIAFLKFVMVTMLQMRYILVIWKSRQPSDVSTAAIRHQLSMLYVKLYSTLLIGFLVLYGMNGMFKLYLIAIHSFWVPQVYCNASRNARHGMDTIYVLGMTLCRLAVPMYVFLCPDNFIEVESSPVFAVVLLIWAGAQVIVLLMQDTRGPRFFIPKRLLPPQYDYMRPVENPSEERDCVICMSPVIIQANDYMITPCNHVYHGACLERWLEMKMECPTCRAALPAT